MKVCSHLIIDLQLLCNSHLSELLSVFSWKWTKLSIELSLNICFWKAICLPKSKILCMGTLHHHLQQWNFGQLNLNMAIRAWEMMNVWDVQKLQLPTRLENVFKIYITLLSLHLLYFYLFSLKCVFNNFLFPVSM